MMSPRGSAFPEDEDVSKMLEERLNDTIVTLAGKGYAQTQSLN